jgi:hypothetical protein
VGGIIDFGNDVESVGKRGAFELNRHGGSVSAPPPS